jgi:hypothetical protein
MPFDEARAKAMVEAIIAAGWVATATLVPDSDVWFVSFWRKEIAEQIRRDGVMNMPFIIWHEQSWARHGELVAVTDSDASH